MKKLILLAAVAFLSLGVSAQGYNGLINQGKNGDMKVKIEANDFQKDVLKNIKPLARSRAVTGMPEGEQHEYFLVGRGYVFNAGSFMKVDKQTVVFGANNKVYLPLMMWGEMLPNVYVEATMASTTTEGVKSITIDNNQVVGQTTVNNTTVNIYLSAVNNTGAGSPSSVPATIYYDEAADVIYCNTAQGAQPVILGLYVDYMGSTILQTMYDSPNYYPVNNSFFGQQTNRTVTSTEEADEVQNQTRTVEDYYMLNTGHFMKGLLNQYPDKWIYMGHPVDENDNVTSTTDISVGLQYLSPTDFLIVGGATLTNMDTERTTLFTYNSSDDTYTQAAGDYIYCMAYSDTDPNTQQPIYGWRAKYNDIKVGAATPTGISNVETSTDKEAVATEYYDLSGRRISAADKGVSIKVEKYADGTSKAVKVLK